MGFIGDKVSRIISVVKKELASQRASTGSHQASSDHRPPHGHPPQPPFHSRPPQPQPQATPFPGSNRPTPHSQPPPPNDPRSYQLTQTLYTPPMPPPPPSPSGPCPYPFHLRIETLGHPAIPLFFRSLPHLPTLLPELHTTITQLLYPHHPPPEVRSVTLFIRPMPGVAYTCGSRLDDAHKEIHLSADYILNCCGGRTDESADADRRAEIEGVLLHELVHCLQFSKACPGGVIEGIADFVRLRGGKGAKHWKREGGKRGDWCGGYSRTGYFLDWLEECYGPGTVAWLNESMRDRNWNEGVFRDITGMGVHGLWKRYKRTFELDGKDDGSDDEC